MVNYAATAGCREHQRLTGGVESLLLFELPEICGRKQYSMESETTLIKIFIFCLDLSYSKGPSLVSSHYAIRKPRVPGEEQKKKKCVPQSISVDKAETTGSHNSQPNVQFQKQNPLC